MKYESSIPYHSKVMDNIKVFWRQTGRQTKSKSKSLYSPSNVKHYTWGYDRIMKSSKVW